MHFSFVILFNFSLWLHGICMPNNFNNIKPKDVSNGGNHTTVEFGNVLNTTYKLNGDMVINGAVQNKIFDNALIRKTRQIQNTQGQKNYDNKTKNQETPERHVTPKQIEILTTWPIEKKDFTVYIGDIKEAGPEVNTFFKREVGRVLYSFHLMLGIRILGGTDQKNNDIKILFVTKNDDHVFRSGDHCPLEFKNTGSLGHTSLPDFVKVAPNTWTKRSLFQNYNEYGEIHLNLETVFYDRHCRTFAHLPHHGIYKYLTLSPDHKIFQYIRDSSAYDYCLRDFFNVIYHEIGHVFGLGHHFNSTNLMYSETIVSSKMFRLKYTQDFVTALQDIYKIPLEKRLTALQIHEMTELNLKRNDYFIQNEKFSHEPNSTVVNTYGLGNIKKFRMTRPREFNEIYGEIVKAEFATRLAAFQSKNKKI